jgi:hypothetical protein
MAGASTSMKPGPTSAAVIFDEQPCSTSALGCRAAAPALGE